MKVGIGYDIHRLVEERKLYLGGIEIPYIKGLIGYSDGDVVLHAIADAMLGALSLGDIGQHFPNADPQYKDVPSRQILKKVAGMVREKKLLIKPKIYPFRGDMIKALAGILEIGEDKINIKATTNEGVGSIGRGDAIAAFAVVTLEEK